MATLTVGDITPRVQYTATSGQTVFAYGFPIFADADLKVYVGSTLKTLGATAAITHYTVSGAASTSGGNVTFGAGLTTGDIVTIYRDLAVARSSDYQTGGDLLAETLNDDLDKIVMMVQQSEADVANRSIRFGQFVTGLPLNEVTDNAADRANKVIGFDSTGQPIATTEIGNYQGNWAASTAYVTRDIIKDTSNNNIYIANTSHTSSGSQPITSNTDSGKWDLLVDAASATTSQTAAATSATAAATSATASATSATSAASSATTATSQASAASTSATAAATSASAASTDATATAADAVSTAADAVSTAADVVSTAADVVSTTADASTATTKAATATTQATTATTQASNASTSATAAATSATNAATSETNAATSKTAAETAKTAAEAAQTAAELAADNFDDVYLGAKSSDPTLDNDGDALTAGDLFFLTTTNRMRVYSGSAWADVALDATTVVSKTSATGSGALPSGTTAQRDGSPAAGYMRFNSTTSGFEGHDGSAWGSIGGGASGTNEEVIYEHEAQVDNTYAIPASTNAMSVGPLVIASGAVVTVGANSTWVII